MSDAHTVSCRAMRQRALHAFCRAKIGPQLTNDSLRLGTMLRLDLIQQPIKITVHLRFHAAPRSQRSQLFQRTQVLGENSVARSAAAVSAAQATADQLGATQLAEREIAAAVLRNNFKQCHQVRMGQPLLAVLHLRSKPRQQFPRIARHIKSSLTKAWSPYCSHRRSRTE